MNQDTKKFIIDVIPLARLPLSRSQFFSYVYDKEIPAGSLVSIPLFRRTIQGIVLGSRSDFERLGNFKLKNVFSVQAENFLTEKQLELAQFISDYYVSPLGISLKHFIPKIVKERKGIRNQESGIRNKNITLTREQQEAVEKILSPKNYKLKTTNYLLHGPASSGKTEVYLEAIARIRKENPEAQFLVLLPELTLTPQALERYGEKFKPEEIVVLTSKISKGLFYTQWEKIRSGEAKIIIGTRMSVFAPFKNLKLIVIDEEQDISFKQWDMNPRYDARTVAEKLAEIFQAPLILGTATPRIETYFKAKNKEYGLLELPKLALQDTRYKIQDTNVEVVDMRKEKWTSFDGKKKANYSFLSTSLQNEISYALRNKLQTILFINHQGMSSFSTCSKCKAVLTCPKCDRALVYSKSGEYKCLHCAYKSGIFPKCKQCGGSEFKNVGIGTHSVEREVRKFFQANIASIDTASSKKPGYQQKIYDDFSQRKIDILIGTQMITKNWDFPNVGLVGVITADSLFSMPDFLTDEQAFSHIMQAIGRTGRTGSRFPGKAIVQTFDPSKSAIQAASEMDYASFYKKIISQREDLSLPPFGKLIKLVCQHTDILKVEKESAKIFEELKTAVAEISPKPRLLGPLDPLISNVRGRRKKQIIIKLPKQKEIPREIRRTLEKLSSDWIIDVDPIQIA
ncbi:MAG TPA: primosomal protein N' [Candidatus Moranbacteria bacterium]|nr:MAG: Primosome assembly protein PriA [Parcubacteria group bacterium GW2011_GWC1_45_14]HAV11377.1 primosomal protein N' [Candidatus Moranbacteria bacterium]